MREEHSVESVKEFNQLVNQNGLSKLFANRVRARIIVTLLYTGEAMTAKEIARGAGIEQSVTIQALELLEPFDIIDIHDEDDRPRYQLVEGDELVEQLRTVAEVASERYFADR